MTYKLSASLTSILTQSKTEADRLGMSFVDAPCLLLGLLRKASVKTNELLFEMGATPSALLTATEQMVTRNSLTTNTVSMTLQPSEGEIVLSPDGQRIMRLTLLEARVAGASVAEEQHLMLAILRDKNNRNYSEHSSLHILRWQNF